MSWCFVQTITSKLTLRCGGNDELFKARNGEKLCKIKHLVQMRSSHLVFGWLLELHLCGQPAGHGSSHLVFGWLLEQVDDVRQQGRRSSHLVFGWLPELITLCHEDEHLIKPPREWVATVDPQAIVEVTRRRAGRGMSAADLKDAKAAAAQTGENGEELLNAFFSARKTPQIREHQWVSQNNAISPYDFLLSLVDGKARHVDANSTAAKFETPLYLSTGEIRHALASDIPYDIYRL
jgi:hypothetical protein